MDDLPHFWGIYFLASRVEMLVAIHPKKRGWWTDRFVEQDL